MSAKNAAKVNVFQETAPFPVIEMQRYNATGEVLKKRNIFLHLSQKNISGFYSQLL